MFFVDSHAHLDSPRFEGELSQVVNRAGEAGVKAIVTIGTDRKSSLRSVEIADAFSQVYAAVGVHPHEAGSFSPQVETDLEGLIKEEKVVAIGEIGLDYHYDHSPRPVQRTVFRKQLELAERHSLPVVVHCREATGDVIEILREKKPGKVIIHCFSGDRDLLDFAIEADCYVSVAGPVTFNRAGQLLEAIPRIPGNRLLIETDCPYLAPVPYRGKRNEPAYVREVAGAVASLLGFTAEDIGRTSGRNLERILQLDLGFGSEQGKISYRIRNSLYLNITNRCTNACSFCGRNREYFVSGYNLKLGHEPSYEEIIRELSPMPADIKEIVFCGFGEPLTRPELVESVAGWVKERLSLKVRVNTNGNLGNPHEILQRLKNKVDAVSVSLNAENEELYNRLCCPLEPDAYERVLRFITLAGEMIPEITVTALEGSGADIERCRQIARERGAIFRLRKLNVVG